MARDDRDVIVVERGESHSPLWWLLVGTALGAGLGLLFAPRSGEETRRDLGKRLAKLREVADDALSGLHGAEEDEEPIHRSESELEDEELPSGIEEPPVRRATAGEASPARLELEQRLAEARARRRRALAAEEDEEPVA
ncbi:MAG: YtxH domain-containing protein [Gemmatimonadales bacterium]